MHHWIDAAGWVVMALLLALAVDRAAGAWEETVGRLERIERHLDRLTCGPLALEHTQAPTEGEL